MYFTKLKHREIIYDIDILKYDTQELLKTREELAASSVNFSWWFLREAATMALTFIGMLMEVDSFGGEDGNASSFSENDCL